LNFLFAQLGLLVSGEFGTRRISNGYTMSSWAWQRASPLDSMQTELDSRGVDIDFQPAAAATYEPC
jgi:hypothetical protein